MVQIILEFLVFIFFVSFLGLMILPFYLMIYLFMLEKKQEKEFDEFIKEYVEAKREYFNNKYQESSIGQRSLQSNNFFRHFQILEIEPTKDLNKIKSAWKVLAKKYHPDSGSSPNEEKLKKINTSYETLEKNLDKIVIRKEESFNSQNNNFPKNKLQFRRVLEQNDILYENNAFSVTIGIPYFALDEGCIVYAIYQNIEFKISIPSGSKNNTKIKGKAQGKDWLVKIVGYNSPYNTKEANPAGSFA